MLINLWRLGEVLAIVEEGKFKKSIKDKMGAK